MASQSDMEKALALAVEAHKGQLDKVQEPLVFHALRVGMKGRTYEEMIVGFLHDAVEDGHLSRTLVFALFGEAITTAVDTLTHRHNEEYAKYIARVACNTLARRVKMWDIRDNLGQDRFYRLDTDTQERLLNKYNKALMQLQDAEHRYNRRQDILMEEV